MAKRSVNRAIQNEEINHAVNVRAYTMNVLRRMMATLNRADAKIFEELIRKLSRMDPERFTVQRLDSMLESVRTLIADSYSTMHGELRNELERFTEYEVAFQTGMFEKTLPDEVTARFPVARVNVEQVYAAALARPFQGALLREWMGEQDRRKGVLIRRAIADGFVANKTTDEIIRELRGTRAKGYADGIIEVSRRDAASVVRTAISHTSAFAQQKVYDANGDLIKGYTWVSTLDTRTTPQCQIRDGKEYDKNFQPIGHDLPWLSGPGLLHWNCRSTRAPVTKSWRELGVDIDEFSPGTRASMDGQVPEKLSYEEWLATQSEERQIEVLGEARAALFTKGELDLKDLYSATGEELTLEELREKERKAFKRAGLD